MCSKDVLHIDYKHFCIFVDSILDELDVILNCYPYCFEVLIADLKEYISLVYFLSTFKGE